ncbi:MAG: hypothetical protein ACI4QM_01445, partial [Alphaproteobacteria bacterium]
MKKILLGCTATAVILIGMAFIGLQQRKTSAPQPVQKVATPQPAQARAVMPTIAPAAEVASAVVPATETASAVVPATEVPSAVAPVAEVASAVVPAAETVPAVIPAPSAPTTPMVQDEPIPTIALIAETAPTAPLRFYSEAEEQILEALENYIYFNDLSAFMRPDIKSDGRDFIITLTNPADPSAPQRELRMTRVDDFNQKAQYRIETRFWPVWEKTVKQLFDNASLSIGSFNETVLWVPDLSLKTNDSILAQNIRLSADETDVSIASVASDFLIGSNGAKMDIASSTDVTDLTVDFGLGTLIIPSLQEHIQILGADVTSDELLQILTASHTQSKTEIPNITIRSVFLGDQPVTAKLSTAVTFDETLKLNLNISDIQGGQNILPLSPTHIRADIEITGLDKDLLTQYVKERQAYNETEEADDETAEGKTLKNDLTKLQDEIALNLGVNINHITLSTAEASIDLSGIILHPDSVMREDQSAVGASLKLAVTNFDTISPKAAPMDEEACKAALENRNVLQDAAEDLPPACQQQSGVLDILRPYLATAQHGTDEAGRPVDTFIIVFGPKGLTIN